MDYFNIDVIIPLSECMSSSMSYSLKSNSLQEAVDMAFSREIYNGERILAEKSMLKKEPVVKRGDIRIVAYCTFDENKELKERFSVDDIFGKTPQSGLYQPPSRLSDAEIKKLLLKDAEINKTDIDVSALEDMVFLI